MKLNELNRHQLKSELILLMDKDKAKEITRKQAEDIGKAIAAALLNQNSLTKNDRDIYTQQIRELSSLEDEISNLNFEKQKIREDHEKLVLELNSTKKIYLKQLEELKSEVKLMQETKDKMKRD